MTTRALASFAANLRYQDLSASTVDLCKRQLLDGLGCLLAGTVGTPGRQAAAMIRECGGSEQATVYADGQSASACQAAMVNGTTLYSVGLHDFLQKASCHPGACVIPVLLAIGEWRRAPGADMLAAMVCGYEVLDRVGRAIMPGHRERGFHPTGTCGTFAAAAAAGRMLGLNPGQLACAFGIAGSQAGGLWECISDGSSVLVFHAGRAAQNGIEAALLARAGLTGPATVLEGERGFLRAYGNDFNAAVLAQGLGGRPAIHDVSLRPYFGVTSTIAAVGAVLEIARRRGGIAAGEVQKVLVRCNPVVARDNVGGEPRTLVAARLSVPFNVALALVRGQPLMRDLEDGDLWDAGVRGMLPRIELAADPSCPRFGSSVEMHFRNGSVEKQQMHSWKGESAESLGWEEVLDKFHHLLAAVIGEPERMAVAQVVRNLDHTDGTALARSLQQAIRSRPHRN